MKGQRGLPHSQDQTHVLEEVHRPESRHEAKVQLANKAYLSRIRLLHRTRVIRLWVNKDTRLLSCISNRHFDNVVFRLLLDASTLGIGSHDEFSNGCRGELILRKPRLERVVWHVIYLESRS